MANIIPCNQIEQEADRLKDLFEPCYKVKAEDLDAMADLIYSASLCASGVGTLDQNNIIINPPLLLTPVGDADIANRINNGSAFTVGEKEIVELVNPYVKTIDAFRTKLVTDYYFMKPGKGDYGTGGTILDKSDFILYKTTDLATITSSTALPPEIIFVTGADIDAPHTIANSDVQEPFTIDDSKDTFFVVTETSDTREANRKIYRVVASAGSYGASGTPFVLTDFLLVEDLSLDETGTPTPSEGKKIKIRELIVSATIKDTGSITNISEAVNNSFRGSIVITENEILIFRVQRELTLSGGEKQLVTEAYGWKNGQATINGNTVLSDFTGRIEQEAGSKFKPTDPTFNETIILDVISDALDNPAKGLNDETTPVIVNNNDLYVKVTLELSDTTDSDYSLYRFTGGNGTYGVGGTTVINGDFLLIETYQDDISGKPDEPNHDIPVKALSTILAPATGERILDSEDLNKFKWYNGTDWITSSDSFMLATSASGEINETKDVIRSGKTSFGGDDPDRQVEIIGDFKQSDVIVGNGTISQESGDQVATILGHTTDFTGANSTYVLEGTGEFASSFNGIFNAVSVVDIMSMHGVGKGGNLIAPTDYARLLAFRANPATNGGNDHLVADIEVKNGALVSKFRVRSSRIEFGDAIKFTGLGSELYTEGATYDGTAAIGTMTIGAPVTNVAVDAQGHLMNIPLILQEVATDAYVGSRLEPKTTTSQGFYYNANKPSLRVGMEVFNTSDTVSATSGFIAGLAGGFYADVVSMQRFPAAYGNQYAGKGAVYSSNGGLDILSNGDGDINIRIGNDFDTLASKIRITSTGYVEFPDLTIALIDSGDGKSATTRDYVKNASGKTQYTVATLPVGNTGDTAIVTDATAPTYLGTLTGGGAVTCPVFFDGTNWVSN